MFGIKTARRSDAFEHADATAVNAGLMGGTKVATAMGWRPVEAIAEGDKVLTFDAGLQTITKVDRIRLWSGQDTCPRQFWPLEVPAGALGNRETMRVLPGQNLMIESDAAEEMYGDPFTLIPAEAVEGLQGVERVPPQSDIDVIILHFSADQVVFSENGALFFCPACTDLLHVAATEDIRPFYSVLTMDEARFLAVQIEEEVTLANQTHPHHTGWAKAVPA